MAIYINDSNAVKEQYSSSGNLSTRISIHDKYSTNKTGFGNWIFSNYDIRDGMKVLELGCGTGSMWKGHEDAIRRCGELVLSDFSEAMVEKAKETIGEYPNVTYKQIDIMDIPFEDDAFDVVIANMMLYHVPDISRGLKEVRRVLKADGSFYCATFGIHGIMEYISGLLSDYGGRVPDSMEELLKLPGVGRKTANLLLGDLYGQEGAVVCDTHCIRICNLLGLASSRDPARVEQQLRAILPPKESSDFCHRIVLHGRAVCVARAPR